MKHSVNSSLPEQLDIPVAGVTFSDGYPEWALRLMPDLPGNPRRVRLLRKPTNEHDPNAIAVVLTGKRIGWIPRGTARFMARELDAGTKWRAWLVSIEQHPEHPDQPGIWLRCSRV